MLRANASYLLRFVRAGGLDTMSVAAIWLPDRVAAVIEKGRARDPDAERLRGELCALYLAQRLVHPRGKRGLPIAARARQGAPLTPEVVYALERAAQRWIREDGSPSVLA